jgi:hypothetical protein
LNFNLIAVKSQEIIEKTTIFGNLWQFGVKKPEFGENSSKSGENGK